MARDENGVDLDRWERLDPKPVMMTPPPTPSTINPLLRAKAPASLQLQTDQANQEYNNNVAKIRVLPQQANSNPSVNSTALGVVNNNVTRIINETLAQIPPPPVVPPSNAIPRPNTRRFSIWDMTPNSGTLGFPGGMTNIGMPAPVLTSGSGGGGGTWPNSPSATDGMFLQLTSSTSLGSAGFINTPPGVANIATFRAGRNLQLQFRHRFPLTSDLTNSRNWIAFTDQYATPGNISGRVPTTPVGNIVGFFFGVIAPSVIGQWYGVCQTNVPASTTVQLTSGAFASSPADTTSHAFQLLMDDVNGNVTFYIDGNLLGTITTNIPSSVNMGLFAGAANTANGNTNMNLEYIYVERDF